MHKLMHTYSKLLKREIIYFTQNYVFLFLFILWKVVCEDRNKIIIEFNWI